MYIDSQLEKPKVTQEFSVYATSVQRRPDPPLGALDQQDSEPAKAKRPVESTGMHPGVYAITMAGWVWLIGSFWAVFGTDSEAAFMVTVSTLFIIIFYGLAAALMGLNRVENDNRTDSFAAFMRTGIDTFTGRMSGVAALIQVALIPIALGAGTMVMAIIIATAR